MCVCVYVCVQEQSCNGVKIEIIIQMGLHSIHNWSDGLCGTSKVSLLLQCNSTYALNANHYWSGLSQSDIISV